MDTVKEGNVGMENQSSWIPVTPGKVIQPVTEKITAADMLNRELDGGASSESEEFPPGFTQKVQFTEPEEFHPRFTQKVQFPELEEFPPGFSQSGQFMKPEEFPPQFTQNVRFAGLEEFPPGFPQNVQFMEPEEFPPGFTQNVQFTEPDEFPPSFTQNVKFTESELYDVRIGIQEPTRRDINFAAVGGESFEAGEVLSIASAAPGLEKHNFSSLLAMADANALLERYGSLGGGYVGPISCSCLHCELKKHHGPSGAINHQNQFFRGMLSANNAHGGLGGLPEAQSLFQQIVQPPAFVDAVTQGMSPPFAPVTPDKVRGVERRNSETENSSACDQTNIGPDLHEIDGSAQGSSREPLKDSQCSTISNLSVENQSFDRGDTLGIEMNKTPQKKTRKKKHRPKVVKEGTPKRTPSRKRTAAEIGVSNENSKPKRKYVRRKGIENVQTTSPEGLCSSTNPETVESVPAKKARRRILKVDAEGKTNSNPSKENLTPKRKYVRRKKGTDNVQTTPFADATTNLTNPTILEGNSSRKSCRRVLNFGSEGTSRDKNLVAEQVLSNSNSNNSLYSDFHPDEIRQLSQALHVAAEDNQTGTSKNDDSWMCSSFPRRKRSRTQLSPLDFSPEVIENVFLTGEEELMAQSREDHNSLQKYKYWALTLSNLQKIKDSDLHYSIFGSNNSAANFGMSGGLVISQRQDANLFPSYDNGFISFHQEGAVEFPLVVGQTGVELGRSVKATGAASPHRRSSEMHSGYINFSTGTPIEAQPSGSYPDFMWNYSRCINNLVKQLQKLNINKKRSWRKNQKLRLVSAYDMTYQQSNALVPYRSAGTIVPYGNPFDAPKERQQRPKVHLDDETNKVWQLLVKDINNKGIDGTDEEKAKWWEEERAVFQGRADSFIARMRLVQGDRHFSPWKGSVVDSVVGVFLTQNVSDHLSSSAFMLLAARFPLKSNQSSCCEEATSSAMSDTQYFIPSSTGGNNSLIPQKVGQEALCENNDEMKNEMNSSSFDGIEMDGNIPTSFTQLLRMANHRVPNGLHGNNGGVLFDEHSTSLNEDFKHNCNSLLHFSGETSESPPTSQSSTVMDEKIPKAKSKKSGKEKKQQVDWDGLRKEAEACGRKTERTPDTMDSLDWEAVRRAHVSEVADTIKERGMNNRLAERIKDFLDRLVRDHGRVDLEWLRDIPPDKAKEYLLSFNGLGLKSVECVRLLTLHHLAFPVDTNVGRIAVRLGWVPLQPLPESLQLHLLEMYPILESIQQYLWPRLCKLDQGTLYELHYQMITFGKVFCTKSKPNCNACPMRGECRHFASAFASARLALPATEQGSRDGAAEEKTLVLNPSEPLPLPSPPKEQEVVDIEDSALYCGLRSCQPIVEEPASPEQEYTALPDNDLEESVVYIEDSDEIPTIRINMEELTRNVQDYLQHNMTIQEDAMSKALVALTPEAASVPVPKLKGYSRLRTEHLVYEIPEGHPLLEGLDKLEPDDPCRYLLAIWTPGETATSIRPPEGGCTSQDCGQLCKEQSCVTCNSVREANSKIVRGTILIPCRTAMRGSFPLNGTYFQVNEVFADHESSLDPLRVPRNLIWNLPRRTVYFGTSIPTIFRGLSTEATQHCFWRGYVCVRGFDRKTRAPRPLMARLHFPASKLKGKGKTNDE